MTNEKILGIVGTGMGVLGSTIQTQEILQIISIIITIIGGFITWIIIPLVNWYRNAKKDGKITKEEIDDALDTASKGIENIKDEVDKHGKKD